MSNIMDLVKLRNKPSRNGFDLSSKNLFTAKIGELLPVQTIECLPGDSFTIDLSWFTRTQPVNTAAYTRFREYYDWYFVPTNLLWNKFNTFITQMVDNNQKANGINSNVVLSDEHPYFTTSQINDYLHNQIVNQRNNMFGLSRAALSKKLLQYLDYGDFPIGTQSAKPKVPNYRLNPFPLLAYQKIYQDYFRNSQWEKAYSPSCNIDYITGAAGSNNIPLSNIDYTAENMFDLRYANWNKDYFMGLLPNSQYGSKSQVQEYTIASFKQSQGVPTTGSQLKVNYVNAQGEFDINAGTANNSLMLEHDFSILALRQAESLQKWREITQSAQQDYKSQISSHFNVEVSDAYSDRCKYLGGISGSLDIEAVQNQNITGTNDASIAGRGEGGNRGKIEFNCKVHGYLMCIYHCVPLLDYAINGTKRINLKTYVTDYAIPEFDQAGMVQVPLIELHSSLLNPDDGFNNTTLLGYAPRYIDYKASYDLVHGAFYNGDLGSWVAPISKNYIREYIKSLGSAATSGIFNYSFFKVPPSVVNPIFGIDVDSFVSTDQLLINSSFDVKAVRQLDRNGLPY